MSSSLLKACKVFSPQHRAPQFKCLLPGLVFGLSRISCLEGDSQTNTSCIKLHTQCHSSQQPAFCFNCLATGFAQIICIFCFCMVTSTHSSARKMIGLVKAVTGQNNALLRKSISVFQTQQFSTGVWTEWQALRSVFPKLTTLLKGSCLVGLQVEGPGALKE